MRRPRRMESTAWRTGVTGLLPPEDALPIGRPMVEPGPQIRRRPTRRIDGALSESMPPRSPRGLTVRKETACGLFAPPAKLCPSWPELLQRRTRLQRV